MITKIYLKPSDIESNEVVYIGDLPFELHISDNLICEYHGIEANIFIHNIIFDLVKNTRHIYCRLFK